MQINRLEAIIILLLFVIYTVCGFVACGWLWINYNTKNPDPGDVLADIGSLPYCGDSLLVRSYEYGAWVRLSPNGTPICAAVYNAPKQVIP